jgi:phosphonopyruvate decarboxylase
MSVGIEAFTESLELRGVSFYTGVPCSYLQSFVSYAASGKIRYFAAASEGEAIALAAGAYLGGNLGIVLIQNSGLGNCVNPLTSLAHTFEIPLLLIVSHRGEGGDDAPQHLLMGEIMYDLLRVMRVSAHTLPDDTVSAAEVLDRSIDEALTKRRPVALVAPKGAFEPYAAECLPLAKHPSRFPESSAAPEETRLVPRLDALRAIRARLDPSDLVITTTGMTSREWFALGDCEANFYMMGSMGCAPAIGLGVALERPQRRVVVIDGDGALLMKLGSAATVGHHAPPGLLHVLLDNGTYETTGGQPTASPTVDFAGVAAHVGYRHAIAVRSTEELADVVGSFRVGEGPSFCSLQILSGHMEGVPRVKPSPQEIRDRFRAFALA